ncbi:MAG TPA: hypothetical protein VFD07_06600 [Candidatus Krumholzibacteria bacterium]|nr:hypothetical protein [Candidatus Krumholzibacteria bacterium]
MPRCREREPGRSRWRRTGDACEITQIVVHDEFFHPTSWQVDSVEAVGGATQVAVQGSGELGNSGFYRRMTHEHPVGSSITVVHRLLGFEFEPSSQGEIVAIDAEFDAALVAPTAPQAQVEHALVFFQDGEIYARAYAPIVANQWTIYIAENLTAADFRDALGRSPDWSKGGTTLRFGFRRRSMTEPGVTTTAVHTMANLNLFIRVRPGPE